LTLSEALFSIHSRNMAKTETLNLRVSADFKRRLVEEAAKETRSVTNYLEATLTRIWDDAEFKSTRKADKTPRK
jgi:hypothetical protein